MLSLIRPESFGTGASPETAGEAVGAAEDAHVAAGEGDELGSQDGAETGHAQDGGDTGGLLPVDKAYARADLRK